MMQCTDTCQWIPGILSGSDGSGYMLAESFQHRIVPVYPALTALKCKGSFF